MITLRISILRRGASKRHINTMAPTAFQLASRLNGLDKPTVSQ